jgi:hypothetical protein
MSPDIWNGKDARKPPVKCHLYLTVLVLLQINHNPPDATKLISARRSKRRSLIVPLKTHLHNLCKPWAGTISNAMKFLQRSVLRSKKTIMVLVCREE